ncbi:hypothetical protein [Flyfo siphovirus Tbat2_3]|nr:hypothetical protein [Flyfo siphovirus Tbat2_3]
MNTLSNERLKEIVEYHPGGNNHAVRVEWMAMARELLAFREAAKEPVAWRCNSTGPNSHVVTLSKSVADSWNDKGIESIPLYAAPPLPVAPDELTKAKLNEIWDERLDKGERFNDSFREGYEYCRALVLNHSEDTLDMVNSPVIPDGWALVPIELTREMQSAWECAPNCNGDDEDENMCNAYRAMIAAAPKPSSET